MSVTIRLAAGALLTLGAVGPLAAADLASPDATYGEAGSRAGEFRLLDEIRGSVLGHDAFGDDTGIGIGAELLTSNIPINSGNVLVDAIFGPRVHLGGVAAIDAEPNYLYAGFTWTLPITDVFFVEGALSMSVNDGGDSGPVRCDWSFREQAAIGMALDENWRILAGIEHLSHAGLCGDANPGITSVSATVGYRF